MVRSPCGPRSSTRLCRVTEAFVGVDVAFALGKRLPISICTWCDGRLVPLALRRLDLKPPEGRGNRLALDETVVAKFADAAVAYVQAVARQLDLQVVCVAIDAPSAYCRPDRKRRAAEVAVNRAGIHCFPTPSAEGFNKARNKVEARFDAGSELARVPHANQLWMLPGFAVFRAFENICDVREVYPQATVQVLGAGQKHKTKRDAVVVSRPTYLDQFGLTEVSR